MNRQFERERPGVQERRHPVDASAPAATERAMLPAAADLRSGGAPVGPMLLGLQARAGNAAVQRLVHDPATLQRAVTIDEIETEVERPAEGDGSDVGPSTADDESTDSNQTASSEETEGGESSGGGAITIDEIETQVEEPEEG